MHAPIELTVPPAEPAPIPRQVARDLGLYVHIPFCVRKCPYCDFVTTPAGAATRAAYVDALCTEIATSPLAGAPVATVFFGGGTPSELEMVHLARIVATLRAHFTIDPAAEWSIECNPGTVGKDHLAGFRELGFTRISIGVQSFHDPHLARLGRIHTAADAEATVRWAAEVGFHSRNVDLMFGLPDQTLAEWEADLARLLELAPEHVSCYQLTIEEGTEFGRQARAGSLPPIDDELAAEMYEAADRTLAAAGYAWYEISNWARPGHLCRHNRRYWENEDCVGFGVSAASYVGGVRWSNVRQIGDYTRRIGRGASAIGAWERLTGTHAAGEALMLGLRTATGIDLPVLAARYGVSESIYESRVQRFVELGLLEREGTRIRLTSRGRLLANLVCAEFLA